MYSNYPLLMYFITIAFLCLNRVIITTMILNLGSNNNLELVTTHFFVITVLVSRHLFHLNFAIINLA